VGCCGGATRARARPVHRIRWAARGALGLSRSKECGRCVLACARAGADGETPVLRQREDCFSRARARSPSSSPPHLCFVHGAPSCCCSARRDYDRAGSPRLCFGGVDGRGERGGLACVCCSLSRALCWRLLDWRSGIGGCARRSEVLLCACVREREVGAGARERERERARRQPPATLKECRHVFYLARALPPLLTQTHSPHFTGATIELSCGLCPRAHDARTQEDSTSAIGAAWCVLPNSPLATRAPARARARTRPPAPPTHPTTPHQNSSSISSDGRPNRRLDHHRVRSRPLHRAD